MSRKIRYFVLLMLSITLLFISFLGDLTLQSISLDLLKNTLVVLSVNAFFLLIDRNVKGFLFGISMFPLAFLVKSPAYAVLGIASICAYMHFLLSSDKLNRFKIDILKKRDIVMTLSLFVGALIVKDKQLLVELFLAYAIIMNVQTLSPMLLLSLTVFVTVTSLKFILVTICSPFIVIPISIVIAMTGVRAGYAIGDWLDTKK